MTTQRTLPRLAIYDGFASASGALIARADGEDNGPFEFSDTRSEDNAERMAFAVPAGSDIAAAVQEARVVRVEYDADVPTNYDEWIIAKIAQRQERAGARMTVECVAPVDALTSCGPVETDVDAFDGMPVLSDGVAGSTLADLFQSKLVDNTALAAVLPFTLAVGSIDALFASLTIDLEWDTSTPAAIIAAAVHAAEQKAQRAAVWDLVRNGAASYDITVTPG